MGRAFFVTPVYIFSSIKAGSGKSSLLASFAVYQNNLGNKVAIIDLDSTTPQKLKNAFPQSIHVKEYQDLNQILYQNESRYQKTFYFTETEQISYFPAMNLLRPEQLFQDTAMRDFFLQTRATFDILLVNFPAGDRFCLSASEILSHVWQGNQPTAIIVSTSDLQSLVKLDGITRKLPALSFQLRENTMIVFNRVPGSLEEQKLSDTALTSHEIKKIFKFPNLFFIGHNEEFPHQKNVATPIVLKTDSLMNLCVSRFNRQLQQTGTMDLDSGYESEFLPCLDGPLLEKLAPYLEKLQNSAAAELLTNPGNLQVFLEESQGKFRVRLRLTGRQERLLRIQGKISAEIRNEPVVRASPDNFKFYQQAFKFKKLAQTFRENVTGFQAKQVYRFNDCFDQQIDKFAALDYEPRKNLYPSPILFRHGQLTADIPTLSQILGFVKKSYFRFPFVVDPGIFSIPGVTHFFIPPEFELAYQRQCAYFPQIFVNFKASSKNLVEHSQARESFYQLPERTICLESTLPDLFARSHPLNLPVHFTQPVASFHEKRFSFTSPAYSKFLIDISAICNCLPLLPIVSELQYRQPDIIPKVLSLSENSDDSEVPESSRKAINWFAKTQAPFTPELGFARLPAEPVKLAQNLVFSFSSKAFSGSIIFPDTTRKIDMVLQLLERCKSLSSPEFFIHHFAPASPQALDPSPIQLPTHFKLEQTLLEHLLKVSFSQEFLYNTNISSEKSSPAANISHKLFFHTPYLKKSKVQSIEQRVKKTPWFNQKISPISQSLKKIIFDPLKSCFQAKWDILQIHLLEFLDRGYKTAPNDKAYDCDQTTDNLLQKRSFAPDKRGMLSIKTEKTELLSLKSRLRNKAPLRLSQNARIEKRHKFNEAPEITTAVIELQRKTGRHSFPDQLLINRATEAEFSSFLFAPPQMPSFTFDDLVLFVTQFHLQKAELFFNKISVEIGDISPITTFLIDQNTGYSLANNQYSYQLDYYEARLNKNLPMRMKKADFPQIHQTVHLDLSRTLAESESTLKLDSSSLYDTNLKPNDHKLISRPLSSEIPQTYPLFKSSLEMSPPGIPEAKSFKIAPPQALEEFYENLLRQYHLQMKAGIPIKISAFSIKAVNFMINHNFTRLKFCEGIYFVRRILHSPEKIRFTNLRPKFKIVDPKLRDLFKLARQTSMKFSEVTGRSGA